jgi:uncharacterized repeat protein (TIGR02543 family)
MANFGGSFSRGAYDSRGFSATVVYSGYTDAANNTSYISYELKLSSTNNNFSSWTLSREVVVNSGGGDVELLGLANAQFTIAKNSVLSVGSVSNRSTSHNADGTKYFDTYGLIDAVSDASYVPNNTRAPLSGTFRVNFPTFYTVTYNANGGSVGTSSVKSADGDAVSLPTPSRSGYIFDGWYNGGSYVGGAGSSYTTTSNASLTANWTADTPAPVFSNPLSIPTLYVGEGQYDQVVASDSTSYSATSLPSGLSLYDYGTYATIQGTVSAQASQYWNVTVTATNDTGSATTSSAFNVYQALPNWTDFSITSTGTVNTYYSSSISATNATNWTISSLPPGITSSGTSGSTVTFSGTPSSAGSYTIYAQPSNSEGASASQQSFSLTISPRLPSWVDQNLATAARVGLSYSSTVSASYVNSWDDGTLPTNGLSFSGQTNVSGTATGTVSGTPTTYGTTSFTLTPYNSDNQTPGGVAFSITVYDVAPVWSSQVLASSIATQDVAYTDGVSVTAGPDVTYTVASGALPTGVTLNSSSGAITGSPSVVGVYNFVLAATNGSSEIIYTDALTITVEAAGGYAKVWNGSAWVDGATYVRTAGGWAEAVINVKGVSSWGPSFSS